MFQPIRTDPPPDQVRRITVVPFLTDRRCVEAWCGERGLAVEPYGVDISPALADLARRRLPRWAGRIWTGNAVNWRPPRPPARSHRLDYRAVSPGGRHCRRPLRMVVIPVQAAGIMTVK